MASSREKIYVNDLNFTVMPAKSVAFTPENLIQETEKAALLRCKRILTSNIRQDDEGRYYFVVFSDEVWVPKSQIAADKTIAEWFVSKNEIYSA